MKYKIVLSVIFVFFLIFASIPFKVTQAEAIGVYESLTVPDVRSNEVNELGIIVARFIGGGLEKNDFAIFRLPAGFIWTTADLGSDETAASAACQTTDQWNTTAFTDDYTRYGTSNYVLVPKKYSGNDNGLFKEATPVLHFTRLNDREIAIRIIDDPTPFQDCYFYLYANRVFIADDYSGDVSLSIDAMPGSVFSSQESTISTVKCTSVPTIYAGIPGQKIGPIVITEVAAGRIGNGHSLTLRLPDGARWIKLAEDSDNNLKIRINGSPYDQGRMAEFKFTGNSDTAAVLTLKDMEVALKPGKRGDLIIDVGGTADLAGKLTVAKIIPPVAVFTVGETRFEINGAENTMDVAPYIKDDRVYLPLRYLAQAAGITESNIIWNQDQQGIEIKKEERAIKLKIGSNIMYINNAPTLMDVAPEIAAPGRTMLPISWVAQALGFEVYWDSGTQKAYFYNGNLQDASTDR